jgi:Arc/MetJ family transcription regulator
MRDFMLKRMRTTLILDDDLVTKAKQLAAHDHRTLSEVVNDALRNLVMPANRLREAPPAYRALTFGDPAKPVAMEPADLARLETEDDRTRLGY